MGSDDSVYTILPLYLISKAEGRFRGRTRLQKLVFLVQKAMGDSFDFEFNPAEQGPLSYRLYQRMENLGALNLVKELQGRTVSGNPLMRYELTAEGKSFLDFVMQRNQLPPNLRTAADKVYAEYGTLPFIELLDRVHTEYPQYVR